MKTSAAKGRIMEVASRLFYEQGYNSTGINQIIDEADIARGSLYNHFPSKRDLLNAYIQSAEELWFEELDSYVSHIKDPGKKLLALFDYRAERQERTGYGGCQFIKIGAEVPKDDKHAFDLISHQKTRIKTYIADLVGQMTFNQPSLLDDKMLIDTLYLLMEGATVTASIYKTAEPLRQAKKIAEKLLI